MKKFLFLTFLSFGIICSISCFSINQQDFALANEIGDESSFFQPQTSEKEVVGGESTTVSITSINPVERAYDGTNIIELEITIDLTVEGLSVTGTGTTVSADVGEGKTVIVDTSSLQLLVGESEDDYILSETLPAGTLSVNITKRPVTFNWGITGGLTTFDHTGNSLLNKINPYYLDINNVSHSLIINVSGNSFTTRPYSPNEFVQPGNYTATIITAESDSNYLLTDANDSISKSLSISRITPNISFAKTSFVYTGEEQDLAEFVDVNNTEQTINYNSLSTKFTTCQEAESLIGIVVSVMQTENYNSKSQVYYFQISKAQSAIDLSSLPNSYTYNGQIQTIDRSLITVNNTEQEISVIVNDGKTMLNADTYRLTIQTIESSNYNAFINDNFYFDIVKKQIDVSLFSWQNTTNFTYEKDRTRTVSLANSSTEVSPVYGGVYSATNAGAYVAQVSSYILNDSDNNEIVGETAILEWTISRRVQSIPALTSQSVLTYNGSLQQITFNVMANTYLSVSNYSATNAGVYEAKIVLNDDNVVWNDWTTDTICVGWSIEKAVIIIPEITQNLFYTGEKQSIPIEESELYNIINRDATSVGQYVSYIVLIDPANYTFEDDTSPYIAISWQIEETVTHQSSSILIIIIGFAVMIFAGLALTLQFTIKKRRRKKRHAEIMNAQVLNKLNDKK